jgi:hypothetical protein
VFIGVQIYSLCDSQIPTGHILKAAFSTALFLSADAATYGDLLSAKYGTRDKGARHTKPSNELKFAEIYRKKSDSPEKGFGSSVNRRYGSVASGKMARAFPAWQGCTSAPAHFATSQGVGSLPGNRPATRRSLSQACT